MSNEFVFPRVQALPEVARASLRIDGVERVGYEYGHNSTRPFLYPIVGPSGARLTRIGHANPVGHEHHKSVWFGHQKVNGINFWEEPRGTDVKVRHKRVVLYQDGPDLGGLVAEVDWWAHGQTQMRQRLTIVLEPGAEGAYALDLQSRFEAAREPIELGQTNFGLLGVRVAKTISEQFGGGRLTNSEGAEGECAIHGKPARWVDYSGPSTPGTTEGIAYLDHPDNPGHPARWHVRRDGWMEAAFSIGAPYGLAAGHVLELRYRLLIHSRPADRAAVDRAWERYASTPAYSETPPRGQSLGSFHRGSSGC
jgi:hypothetical protein